MNIKKIIFNLFNSTALTGIILATPAFASAATLSLSPVTGTFNRGCSFALNIELDTEGKQTDGTDALLKYDPTRFTATSISNGTIYPEYPGNSIDTQAGKINISGLADVTQAFSSKGVLATINFSVVQSAPTGTTPITFDFDTNDRKKTIDSNVIERGTIIDLLSSVTNGSYIVGTGSCSSQTQNPATGITSTPGGTTGTTGTTTTTTRTGRGGTTGVTGKGGLTDSTDSGKTLDDIVGDKTGLTTPTFVLTIVGTTLTILGILGLALL